MKNNKMTKAVSVDKYSGSKVRIVLEQADPRRRSIISECGLIQQTFTEKEKAEN